MSNQITFNYKSDDRIVFQVLVFKIRDRVAIRFSHFNKQAIDLNYSQDAIEIHQEIENGKNPKTTVTIYPDYDIWFGKDTVERVLFGDPKEKYIRIMDVGICLIKSDGKFSYPVCVDSEAQKLMEELYKTLKQ